MSAAIAAALALAVAAASGISAQGTERDGAVAVPSAPGVVVVPFANVTEIPADDWIGAGIADAIAAGVAQGGLRVVELRSPATAEAWAALVRPGDAERLARDAGLRAGARWIVAGGVQRMGESIRITARVTDARTGAVVGSVRLDGALAELFDLQDELETWVLETVPRGVPPRSRPGRGGAGARRRRAGHSSRRHGPGFPPCENRALDGEDQPSVSAVTPGRRTETAPLRVGLTLRA